MLSRAVTARMVFPEPPSMATPASKPLTVPFCTVTPVTLTRRNAHGLLGPVGDEDGVTLRKVTPTDK
jgi:hypothetical protein